MARLNRWRLFKCHSHYGKIFFIWRRFSRHGDVFTHTDNLYPPPANAKGSYTQDHLRRVIAGNAEYYEIPSDWIDPYSDYETPTKAGRTQFDATLERAVYYHKQTKTYRPMKVVKHTLSRKNHIIRLAYDGEPIPLTPKKPNGKKSTKKAASHSLPRASRREEAKKTTQGKGSTAKSRAVPRRSSHTNRKTGKTPKDD